MGALSFGFLGLTTVVALGFRLFRRPWLRTVLFTLANALFVASFAKTPLTLLPLAGFLLVAWVGAVALRKKPGRAHLAAWLAVNVVGFVVLKQYAFVEPLLKIREPLVTVGLSYLLFRVLHLLIDLGTGTKLEGLTAVRFFNYVASFLTFESGPIQRFDDHLRELGRDPREGPALDGELLLDAGSRAIVGLVKLSLAAPLALEIHEWGSHSLAGKASPLAALPDAVNLCVATLGYLVFLYWNFSGYMDIVLAGGRLIGFSLPENFTNPWSSPNFIELWSRWHITLSDWFRFYLFNPIVTGLTRLKTSLRLAPYYGVLGFLVTFFVMGVWHGTTGIFVFYGLLLGAATAANKLYQVQMRAWLGKQRQKRLSENPVYERICNGLCIGFFALALACFWLDWRDLGRLVRRVGAGGLLGGLAASVIATIVIRLVFDGIRLVVERPRVHDLLTRRAFRQAWTSLALVILVVHAAANHSDLPAFVYAEF